MKKIQLIIYFVILSSFIACSSCPDEFSDDDDGEKRQNFSLRYERSIDNWQPVVGAFGYIHEDSVKLYDESYDIIESFVTDVTGDCSFVYVDTDTPKETNLIKIYYLYLSYQDTDTIRQEYRVNKKKCKHLLDYGKLYYNNQLIKSITNDTGIPFASITKN
ncbi:hypothetical protein Fleli_2476 [Bernardetia litoralis DSM 6794]|uniref:Lipoprotein n=1 Tax=Bernardetia litoralis (strain ATCC 23117 / DSM 6794 / NBRC 15988 / NCIMB 1366 / Fx l1 / Sio-4) TaxID=880071 RepID=I4ALK6_BERLS|nr:hypothetical protein [Bernardetia litoralis]AFM04841.1 hypothetical protein Fleli_2476 [Bernardetia litoralis DSM 6794]